MSQKQCRMALVLLWFRIIDKTIKTLGFHNICSICQVSMCHLEVYSEPCQTSKIEHFVKIVNDFQPLSIFAKRSILDIWEGCEYAYVKMT